MTLGERLAANAGDPARLLEILLSGTSQAAGHVRERVMAFCANPLARAALLWGPIGCGKSTVARAIALLRYLVPQRVETRRHFLRAIRFDGPMRIDKGLLDWYEELNLTGLTESLAEAQLFGTAEGAATHVSERPGIFEMAGRGHMHRGDITLGAKITRGVVLLDEIGDLPLGLQPKLLAVLTGAEVFRVGGEGNPKWGFTFNGTTITATWRDPNEGIHVRPDLLSRVGDYVIKMPGLNERPEDLQGIVRLMVDDIHRRLAEEVKRLSEIGARDQPMDRDGLARLGERRLKITDEDIRVLERHPWSRSGELRGLRQVLERALFDGTTILGALDRQADIFPTGVTSPDERQVAAAALSLLRARGRAEGGLSERVKEIERRVRSQIREILSGDMAALKRTADAIGMDPDRLKEQLSDLDRVRKTRRRSK